MTYYFSVYQLERCFDPLLGCILCFTSLESCDCINLNKCKAGSILASDHQLNFSDILPKRTRLPAEWYLWLSNVNPGMLSVALMQGLNSLNVIFWGWFWSWEAFAISIREMKKHLNLFQIDPWTFFFSLWLFSSHVVGRSFYPNRPLLRSLLWNLIESECHLRSSSGM